jgi:hypothetical protein
MAYFAGLSVGSTVARHPASSFEQLWSLAAPWGSQNNLNAS